MGKFHKKDYLKSKKYILKSSKVWYYIVGVTILIVASVVSNNFYGGERRKLDYNIIQMKCRLDYLQGGLDSKSAVKSKVDVLQGKQVYLFNGKDLLNSYESDTSELELSKQKTNSKEIKEISSGRKEILETKSSKDILSDVRIVAELILIENEVGVTIDEIKINCPRVIYYNDSKEISKLYKEVNISVNADRASLVDFIKKLREQTSSARVVEVDAETDFGDDAIDAVIKLEYY